MAPLPADLELVQSNGYFPAPHSLEGLSSTMKEGLLALGTISAISASFLIFVIIALTSRLISHWHVNRRNQCFVSVYNLFIADLVQAVSLIISFRWIVVDGILAPSNTCAVQGFLLNLGDLGSGSFVLLISIQTSFQVLRDRPIPHWLFNLLIILIWGFCILLSAIGPVIDHSMMRFFARAGNWCWISDDYEGARLGLHYFWIFFFEMCSGVIYISLYVYLYTRAVLIRRNAAPGTEQEAEALTRKIRKGITPLVFYPIIYILLTLPLAICRMRIMSGHDVPNFALLVSGCIIVSSGLFDSILYTLSRSVLRDTPIGQGTESGQTQAAAPPTVISPPRATCTNPRPRPRSGWSTYQFGIDTGITPASTANSLVAAPASSRYSVRTNSQILESRHSSRDGLIAREAGSSILAPHAIPLSPMSPSSQAYHDANGPTSPIPTRGPGRAPVRGHRRTNKSDTTFFALGHSEAAPAAGPADELRPDSPLEPDRSSVPRLVRAIPTIVID